MASLPDYVSAAKPVPQGARQAWYKNIAPTYAGVMLWFVFWQGIAVGNGTPGGTLAAGLGAALLGVLLAALFCHFLTYLVPGLFGQKTGLPLYLIGTSVYGVKGGFLMPGFFMGVLQFGWLAVNGFFTIKLICNCFDIAPEANDAAIFTPNIVHAVMTILFVLLAVFIGLKGIKYVAKVATFVPLIPLVILIILMVKTAGGLSNFNAEELKATASTAVTHKTEAVEGAQARLKAAQTEEEKTAAEKSVTAAENNLKAAERVAAKQPIGALLVFLTLSAVIVGFFATAGAAGVDFGMNSRNVTDVQLGGLVGIVGVTVFAAGAALLIVAGAYGAGLIPAESVGQLDAVEVMKAIVTGDQVMGLTPAKWLLFLLAVSAFAPACFPAFIAANSFKTTMPKFGNVAVGIGTLAAIALAVSGWAGQAVAVFAIVGASFGPICGAMLADYVLAGGKWAGPRAGFNPAGWISWAVGFYLGAIGLIAEKIPAAASVAIDVPCPAMTALVAGFLVYFILAKLGLQSRSLEMPAGE